MKYICLLALIIVSSLLSVSTGKFTPTQESDQVIPMEQMMIFLKNISEVPGLEEEAKKLLNELLTDVQLNNHNNNYEPTN